MDIERALRELTGEVVEADEPLEFELIPPLEIDEDEPIDFVLDEES